ncbi:MAG: hypothetical protein HRF50_02775 [Phycisphaerae bacterium]
MNAIPNRPDALVGPGGPVSDRCCRVRFAPASGAIGWISACAGMTAVGRRFARARGVVALALVALSCTAAALAQGGRHRFVGAVVQDIAYAGPPAMMMPTDAAVGADGRILVADGVNDRVLAFEPDGIRATVIDSAGARALSQPTGLDVDAAGRVWIADTGNRRIVALSADGGLAFELDLSDGPAAAPVDLTDVAADPDGVRVWFVDNNNHRLGQFEPQTGVRSFLGQSGESLGQFRYPFQAVCAPNGDLFVTDVINGRVQVFGRAGRPAATISAYGVELGDLYRPKGVALDREGNVWVSDSIMGVVQVFRSTGLLLDVLRDPGGDPLRFEAPTGLAFDRDGNLLVIELSASRIRRVRIAADPTAQPVHTAGQGGALGTPQPRACTACHFDWMQPLVDGKPTQLVDPPRTRPNEPYAARAANCLSCHDGAVGDSRRRVWVEHGHRADVPPPAGFDVPKNLPLVDGKIACRTCHSAHARGGSGNELKDVVFLRAEKSPSELCMSCHRGLDGGVAEGMHPVTAAAIPKSAMGAAAHEGKTAEELSCLGCHQGHGARYERLLVADPGTNDLCLSCHKTLSPELFSEATRSRHGREPLLNDEQRAVAETFATRVGANGELLCSTCHAPHHAASPEHLLAFQPDGGQACLGCHSELAAMAGSPHDLASNHPQATNVLGASVADAGMCSACHTGHRFARPRVPTALDPSGQCMTCHAPGQLAEHHLGDVNHPRVTCTECHNPHEPSLAKFLCAPAADTCRGCHAAQAELAGGPHDLKRDPLAWPQAAAETQDGCLACHRPHGDSSSGLFRIPLAATDVAADASCVGCHSDAEPGLDSRRALVHPRRGIVPAETSGLLVATDSEGRAMLSCRTCHDPHRSDGVLLRGDARQGYHDLCLNCHPDRGNIDFIGHAPELIHTAGFDSDACRPCHNIHGDVEKLEPRYLWPKALEGPAAVGATATAASLVPSVDRHCTACHREGGPVAPPAIASHPDVAMYNTEPPDSPGFLPLFGPDGSVAPNGKITCRTCHLTHGRSTPLPMPEGAELPPLRELRARQWHIRSLTGNALCSSCHGYDALRRFIFFHDAARRGGPITQPAAGGGAPAAGRRAP